MTVSKSTNVQVYNVIAVKDGKNVSIEIVYNPTTDEGTVVDTTEVVYVQEVYSSTEVKAESGVTEVTTTNTTTITERAEYKQIIAYLI